ncbi:T9SS type A sorting domain-containing protein [Marinigracilibium pacificum]|uniref:T9SS type A sorting domain-containing protein n=1 Tax=Marinigracilibium pacificum TaxID=2729599 RepID=A0A848J711_9BACT|nr:T9SS type A sorting domain-containing protein [Marinigracilibium pacificum]NMM50179.1 T9SS type A sorting domain-containing protein [Marinigracilibium pacificum]
MRIFFLSTFIFFTLLCNAQQLEINTEEKIAFTASDSEKSFPITITASKFNKPIQIGVEIESHSMDFDEDLKICYNGRCISVFEKIPASFLEIKNPSDLLKVTGKYIPGNGEKGLSDITLRFFNVNSPNVYVEKTMTFNNSNNPDVLYADSKLSVGNIYPNPVVNFGYLKYNLKAQNIKAKVLLQNVLGSTIEEIPLSPYENTLKLATEGLNPGVYFYTLVIDDQNIATKKFIIQ